MSMSNAHSKRPHSQHWLTTHLLSLTYISISPSPRLHFSNPDHDPLTSSPTLLLLLQSRIPLFFQHGLIKPRQRANPGPHKHPHTAPWNSSLHNPRARARPPTPHIYHPRGDRLDGIETHRIIPALAFQIDKPAAQQRQENARQEPEADGTPERGREQGEEIGALDRVFGRPERGDRRERREVAQGEDLEAEAEGFDE